MISYVKEVLPTSLFLAHQVGSRLVSSQVMRRWLSFRLTNVNSIRRLACTSPSFYPHFAVVKGMRKKYNNKVP